ncbi:MAG: transcriptional repressor [Bacteroidetes bacterium]|nr:transcriptional repressor [Bacteroidota bacterium]
MEATQKAVSLLETAQLRQTPQRIVILATLLAEHTHPSAEDLHLRISPQLPSISIGTVYRTLESLVEAGIVRKVRSESGTMFFDANIEPHHHLYDEHARRIADFEDARLHALIAEYLQKHPIPGFDVYDFQLHISGSFQPPVS